MHKDLLARMVAHTKSAAHAKYHTCDIFLTAMPTYNGYLLERDSGMVAVQGGMLGNNLQNELDMGKSPPIIKS